MMLACPMEELNFHLDCSCGVARTPISDHLNRAIGLWGHFCGRVVLSLALCSFGHQKKNQRTDGVTLSRERIESVS
jgi:hypothetical protein